MSFYSEFFFNDLVTAPESFCRWLQENVARPYSTSEQSARLDTCQRALSEGKLSDADPVSLLNALWQGVVRGSPYINEIALLMSMADSSIGQNERAVN